MVGCKSRRCRSVASESERAARSTPEGARVTIVRTHERTNVVAVVVEAYSFCVPPFQKILLRRVSARRRWLQDDDGEGGGRGEGVLADAGWGTGLVAYTLWHYRSNQFATCDSAGVFRAAEIFCEGARLPMGGPTVVVSSANTSLPF